MFILVKYRLKTKIIKKTRYKIQMSVSFLSFFNRGGREEGTENTEICQDILCDLRAPCL